MQERYSLRDCGFHIDGLGGLFLAILGVIGFLYRCFTRLAICVMKGDTASFHPLRCIAITTVSSICFVHHAAGCYQQ